MYKVISVSIKSKKFNENRLNCFLELACTNLLEKKKHNEEKKTMSSVGKGGLIYDSCTKLLKKSIRF